MGKSKKRGRGEDTEETQPEETVSTSPNAAAPAAAAASPPSPPSSPSPSPPASSSLDTTSCPLSVDKRIRLFSTSSPRSEQMKLHYVSTPKQVSKALRKLRRESVLSVDCEGVSLSRTGELCLIQVSGGVTEDGVFHVWLFDVTALGKGAFDSGLGELLQAPQPTKLFYDVRRDSESLYHQFGIKLRGVCDVQLLEIARRRLRSETVTYLPGLARLLSERFSDLDPTLQSIKDGMSSKYDDEPDLWRKRPLGPEQLIYAATDVALLHILLHEITTPMDKLPALTDKSESQAVEAVEAAEKAEQSEEKQEESKDGGESTQMTTIDIVRKSSIHVNQQTQEIISQYSDVVWAASIRDLEGEQDLWSRRHVPLVFHHATFPLSLQAQCQRIVEREKEEAEADDQSEKKKQKNKEGKNKRKAEEVKLDAASLSATLVSSSSSSKRISSSSSTSSSSSSSSVSSVSSLVSRLASSAPKSRGIYGGVASTLQRLRRAAAMGETKGVAAEGRHREPSSSKAQGSSSSGASAAAAAAASSTPSLQSVPVNAHFGNPAAFHPQVTKELIKLHEKQSTIRQPSKKQKVMSDAF